MQVVFPLLSFIYCNQTAQLSDIGPLPLPVLEPDLKPIFEPLTNGTRAGAAAKRRAGSGEVSPLQKRLVVATIFGGSDSGEVAERKSMSVGSPEWWLEKELLVEWRDCGVDQRIRKRYCDGETKSRPCLDGGLYVVRLILVRHVTVDLTVFGHH